MAHHLDAVAQGNPLLCSLDRLVWLCIRHHNAVEAELRAGQTTTSALIDAALPVDDAAAAT